MPPKRKKSSEERLQEEAVLPSGQLQRPFVAPTPNMYPVASAATLAGQRTDSYGADFMYQPIPSLMPWSSSTPLSWPLQQTGISPLYAQSQTGFSGIGTSPFQPADSINMETTAMSLPIPDVPLPAETPQLSRYRSSRFPSDAVARKVPRVAEGSSPSSSRTRGALTDRMKDVSTAGKRQNQEVDMPEKPTKRPRGRPRGSKNKTSKFTKGMSTQLQSTSSDHKFDTSLHVPKKSKQSLSNKPGNEESPSGSEQTNTNPLPIHPVTPTQQAFHSPSTSIPSSSSTTFSSGSSTSPNIPYPIPESLAGVHRSLGANNWDEYMALTEYLCRGAITPEVYATRTKAICQMDDRTRKWMNRIMRGVVEERIQKDREAHKEREKNEKDGKDKKGLEGAHMEDETSEYTTMFGEGEDDDDDEEWNTAIANFFNEYTC